MNPTDRARDLGTEHGARVAEEWMVYVGAFDGCPDWWTGEWPQPDLSAVSIEAVGGATYEVASRAGLICDAYEAAFTAAVEATIRAKCEETGR